MTASMSNPHTPPDGLRTGQGWLSHIPDFVDDDSFIDIVKTLSLYVIKPLID